MNQVTVSAPGKLMLFGEHAVVFGKPCIVTAVNQRLTLKAQKIAKPYFELEAQDVGITNYRKPLKDLGKGDIPKSAKFVEMAVRSFIDFIRRHPRSNRGSINKNNLMDSRFRGNDRMYGFRIQTISQFKSVFGFGSSSASTVCAIFALSKLFNIKLSPKQIFDLSFKTVLDIQGVGSGFDIASAIYGGTLYFVRGGKVIKPLKVSSLPLVVGYTGIKADTPTIVKEIQAKKERSSKDIGNIFSHVQQIVTLAEKALVKNDLEKLGKLMNENQTYLDKLGVSSKILDKLINAARNAGAYGAKLSGAGYGDCMIALIPPSKKKVVEDAITKAGGQVLNVETNVEGVRVEK